VTAVAGSGTAAVSGAWPRVVVGSRLSAADLSGSIRFRRPTSPAAPDYAVDPGALAGGLLGAAALSALAAAGLAGLAINRRRRRARSRELSPFELALAYARDAARRRDPADRRKALELLADAVSRNGEPALARVAADTAWSQPPPTPADALELADQADATRTEPW
jgi:hypothetical protein